MRWLLVVALMLAAATPAEAKTTWLCRPGLKTCDPGLQTTRVSPTGAVLGTFTPKAVKGRPVDCFYVYPTVSDQPTPVANQHIDPEERSIALYQAARYSSVCRVFAPMYRQVTLTALFGGKSVTSNKAYADVRDAWRDYLEHDNHGRGVILIGHSQGTFVLRQLIAKEIDAKPAVRKLLVSAVLLGGNVETSDFKHIGACHSNTQLGCVIAFSTFNATPPADSLFGRPGDKVICTNPAALGGGSGALDTILPSAPFAPTSSLGKITPTIGYPAVSASTPWIESDGLYHAQCMNGGGANVLQIVGTPTLTPLPDATWGLHLADANLALGNLIGIVTDQAKRYLKDG